MFVNINFELRSERGKEGDRDLEDKRGNSNMENPSGRDGKKESSDLKKFDWRRGRRGDSWDSWSMCEREKKTETIGVGGFGTNWNVRELNLKKRSSQLEKFDREIGKMELGLMK